MTEYVHVDFIIEEMKKEKDVVSCFVAIYRALYGEDFNTKYKEEGSCPHGRANTETDNLILETMFKMFPNEDRLAIGFYWLNKGFSIDETIPDNLVKRGDV